MEDRITAHRPEEHQAIGFEAAAAEKNRADREHHDCAGCHGIDFVIFIGCFAQGGRPLAAGDQPVSAVGGACYQNDEMQMGESGEPDQRVNGRDDLKTQNRGQYGCQCVQPRPPKRQQRISEQKDYGHLQRKYDRSN